MGYCHGELIDLTVRDLTWPQVIFKIFITCPTSRWLDHIKYIYIYTLWVCCVLKIIWLWYQFCLESKYTCVCTNYSSCRMSQTEIHVRATRPGEPWTHHLCILQSITKNTLVVLVNFFVGTHQNLILQVYLSVRTRLR